MAEEAQALTLPPTTTHQENVTLSGQRRVNIIWEATQAVIALVVVVANMAPPLISAFTGKDARNVPESVTNTLFLVVGFYFSRTNHSSVGGVGAKREGEYTGR